jgi:hypothetical protein
MHGERIWSDKRDNSAAADETAKRPPSPHHIAKDHDSAASRIKINLHIAHRPGSLADMSKLWPKLYE